MKLRKELVLLLITVMFTVALAGCGGSADYADGTYEGKSSVYEGDEDGNGDGYGVVIITIENNEIIACEYETYETDGTLKDEEYGKASGEVANADFYNKAQRAVLASQQYAEQLAQAGSLDDVDAVTGATISYDQFREAVENALEDARK